MIEITRALLETRPADEVVKMLMNSGIESLQATQLVCEALKTTSKIMMQKLIIVWSERLVEENVEFTSWDTFNAKLEEITQEHDKDGYTGAYAKTKFQIIWQDGEVYEGRLDINTQDDTNVGQHTLDFLNFHSGKHCPAHMSEAEYQNYLSQFGIDDKQGVQDYIDRYKIVV